MERTKFNHIFQLFSLELVVIQIIFHTEVFIKQMT